MIFKPRNYEHDAETRAALDLIRADHFSPDEPGLFAPLDARGDYYMHLADLVAYLETDARLVGLYADPQAWAGKAILNVAASGKFSSDRTIASTRARSGTPGRVRSHEGTRSRKRTSRSSGKKLIHPLPQRES